MTKLQQKLFDLPVLRGVPSAEKKNLQMQNISKNYQVPKTVYAMHVKNAHTNPIKNGEKLTSKNSRQKIKNTVKLTSKKPKHILKNTKKLTLKNTMYMLKNTVKLTRKMQGST